jgi:hemoglobin
MQRKMTSILVVLAASTFASGCATVPPTATEASAAPTPQSLYDRLGGKAAITAVVDDSIGNFAADPRINQRFRRANVATLRTQLIDLLCARTGGPCTYRGRNMADVHEGMNVRDDEFDALAEDIVKSLDKLKVPVREKGELLAILERMRNAVVGH